MSESAADTATLYMRIESLGFIGAAVSFALASCLRGAGDTRTPMVILGGVNVVNVLATWLLARGIGPIPAFGTNGIAWGTVVARWAGAVWIVILLLRRYDDSEAEPLSSAHTGFGKTAGRNARSTEADSPPPDSPRRYLRLSRALMRLDGALLYRMLAIGIPAAADGTLAFTGHLIFMTIVTRIPSAFPTTILYAAHIVGIRIEALSYLPATAWSVAASAMVGQNLGAGQPDRARQAAHEAVRQAVMLLAFMGIFYFFAAEPLFRFLSDDPDVWRCGVPALKGLGCFQIPLAILIVYLGALRGAGDTRTPMFITAAGMALVRIPVAALGGFVLKAGLLGAWSGMFADITIRAGLLAWRFRTGRWQKVRV